MCSFIYTSHKACTYLCTVFRRASQVFLTAPTTRAYIEGKLACHQHQLLRTFLFMKGKNFVACNLQYLRRVRQTEQRKIVSTPHLAAVRSGWSVGERAAVVPADVAHLAPRVRHVSLDHLRQVHVVRKTARCYNSAFGRDGVGEVRRERGTMARTGLQHLNNTTTHLLPYERNMQEEKKKFPHALQYVRRQQKCSPVQNSRAASYHAVAESGVGLDLRVELLDYRCRVFIVVVPAISLPVHLVCDPVLPCHGGGDFSHVALQAGVLACSWGDRLLGGTEGGQRHDVERWRISAPILIEPSQTAATKK